MKHRWYISTLIIILTLIGVVCEQQGSVPNQELVLQFTDAGVTAEDTQNTLELVKNQLEGLGVENIQVKEQESGNITITYYSDTDVAVIKQILSEENSLELDYTPYNPKGRQDSKLPSNENSIAFNLDVHEIQKSHDAHWNLNGTQVLELKPKNNFFYSPSVYASFQDKDVKGHEGILKVAYKINKTIVITIDDTSRNIPEVRAGPVC